MVLHVEKLLKVLFVTLPYLLLSPSHFAHGETINLHEF